MEAPMAVMRDTPVQIEALKKDQRSIMNHIVEKKSGFIQFNTQLEKFKQQFQYLVESESCSMINTQYLNEFSTHVAVKTVFSSKYPCHVAEKFIALASDSFMLRPQLQSYKLFNILLSASAYYNALLLNIPFNQQFID